MGRTTFYQRAKRPDVELINLWEYLNFIFPKKRIERFMDCIQNIGEMDMIMWPLAVRLKIKTERITDFPFLRSFVIYATKRKKLESFFWDKSPSLWLLAEFIHQNRSITQVKNMCGFYCKGKKFTTNRFSEKMGWTMGISYRFCCQGRTLHEQAGNFEGKK